MLNLGPTELGGQVFLAWAQAALDELPLFEPQDIEHATWGILKLDLGPADLGPLFFPQWASACAAARLHFVDDQRRNILKRLMDSKARASLGSLYVDLCVDLCPRNLD